MMRNHYVQGGMFDKMQTFFIIGITDTSRPYFSPEVRQIIANGKYFSGGKRHHVLVEEYLPIGAQWIDITVPLDGVFQSYAEITDSIIIFASGDPLFFGFANTVQKKLPDADIKVYPSFNSLQMLAHRLLMPYSDMHIVSLTGRPWHLFDCALIERREKIGILTDKEHTPAAIAQRMLEYGYDGYTMYVGEHLGNPTEEKLSQLTLQETTKESFGNPNCIILKALKKLPARIFGIPDEDFFLLNGRIKMITKMPIRLLTLQNLELYKHRVFWDIGFCTGSVSIEAKLQFPHLEIYSFEIREEGAQLMHDNSRKFGAPGINYYIGDFLSIDISNLPIPDAVFIGGHGGKLQEIFKKVLTVLHPDGCIVMNSVSASSRQQFNDAVNTFSLCAFEPVQIILNDNNPIDILKCKQPLL